MALVRKANVVLNIKDDAVNRYLNMGYDLIDDNGNTIKHCNPNDLTSYKKAYNDCVLTIEKMNKEITDLSKKLKKAEKELKELKSK